MKACNNLFQLPEYFLEELCPAVTLAVILQTVNKLQPLSSTTAHGICCSARAENVCTNDTEMSVFMDSAKLSKAVGHRPGPHVKLQTLGLGYFTVNILLLLTFSRSVLCFCVL